MRKFVFAALVSVFAFSIATAETFFGRVSDLTGKKVTVTKFKKGEKKGEETTLDLAGKVTYKEGGMFKKGEGLVGGETITATKAADLVKNSKGKKGRFAIITTNEAGKVTTIHFMKGFGKGKKKKSD